MWAGQKEENERNRGASRKARRDGKGAKGFTEDRINLRYKSMYLLCKNTANKDSVTKWIDEAQIRQMNRQGRKDVTMQWKLQSSNPCSASTNTEKASVENGNIRRLNKRVLYTKIINKDKQQKRDCLLPGP